MLKDSKIDPPLGILTRPYKIDQFTLTTASTVSYQYPWNSLVGVPRVKEVLKNYTYMRADVRIRFLFNCPITTYGMIAVTPLFGNTSATLSERNTDSVELLSYPGTILSDCSQRESIEVVVPYVSLFDHFPLHQGLLVYNGTYMRMFNLHTMLPDDANPSVEVEVYANFENVLLNGPRLHFDEANGHMNMDSSRRVSPALVVATVATTMGFSGLGSLIGVASQAASMMGGTENIDRLPEDDIGKNNNPTPTRIIPWGNIVSNSYTDTQQYLASAKFNSSPNSPLNGPNHSFNFYDLIKIPAFVSFHQFKVGDTATQILAPEMTSGYIRDVTRLFRRYRGSYKLMLRFVCSPLTVARFNVSFGWGNPVSNITVGDMYSYIVSIQGTHTEYFQIPYLSLQHWIHSTISGPVPENRPFVYINCLSTDTASSLAPSVPSITCYMWLAAGDDFVMQHPQSPFYFADDIPPAADGHMNLCAAFRTESFTPISGISMVATDPRDVEDLHTYFNRYSKAGPSVYTSHIYHISDDYYETRHAKVSDYTGTLEWLSWYFGLYTSGGRRYKVPVDTDVDLVLQNSFTRGIIGEALNTNILFEPCDAVTRSYAGQQSIVEFEVPFICEYGMYPVWRYTRPPTSEFSYVYEYHSPIPVQIADIVSNPPVKEAILTAAGHDYQLHILQPPSASSLLLELIYDDPPPPELPSTPQRPISKVKTDKGPTNCRSRF